MPLCATSQLEVGLPPQEPPAASRGRTLRLTNQHNGSLFQPDFCRVIHSLRGKSQTSSYSLCLLPLRDAMCGCDLGVCACARVRVPANVGSSASQTCGWVPCSSLGMVPRLALLWPWPCGWPLTFCPLRADHQDVAARPCSTQPSLLPQASASLPSPRGGSAVRPWPGHHAPRVTLGSYAPRGRRIYS